MWPFRKSKPAGTSLESLVQQMKNAKRLTIEKETTDLLLVSGISKEQGGIPLSIDDLQEIMDHGFVLVSHFGNGGKMWVTFRKTDKTDMPWFLNNLVLKQVVKNVATD